MKEIRAEEYFSIGFELGKRNYWTIFFNFLIYAVLCVCAAITVVGIFILPAILKYHFISFPMGQLAFGFFTDANEAIIAIDNNGIILRTNNKANQLFNISQEDIQVKNITEYIIINLVFEKYNTKYIYFFVLEIFAKLCIVDLTTWIVTLSEIDKSILSSS